MFWVCVCLPLSPVALLSCSSGVKLTKPPGLDEWHGPDLAPASCSMQVQLKNHGQHCEPDDMALWAKAGPQAVFDSPILQS